MTEFGLSIAVPTAPGYFRNTAEKDIRNFSHVFAMAS
jgi:hypothetical protein